VNVWQNTTLSNCDVTKKLVQFLIISDGELEVAGYDTCLLVVSGSIAGKLENFGRKVLKNGSEVDWSTGTDTLSVVALPQQAVNTADWESETSF
jgi:hypothetical protein